MKLRRTTVRKNKSGKAFYRFLITVPSEVVDELGWERNEELEPEVDGGELRLKPTKRRRTR